MTMLQNFIQTHSEHVSSPLTKPDQIFVQRILSAIGFHNAKELERYLVTYGWLAYGSVEFLGADDKISDMLDATLLLHKSFPMSNGYAALERLGDGVWALCDGHGRVFKFFSEDMRLEDCHKQLEEYVLARFLEEDKEQ